ncbi:D-ribose pyranase [Streptomyces subrutilus]|uniref:D-ribose pyranase n=1 Tax=Streptomyces subrutilus TaxID=36818 RepID=A0A5P2UYD6_9ACTN|nr:D-ribose pyranase [Streptomyces subrutilus]QEU82514.1 D-ribose pyranase [Streptomyces subrutilus]WSJ28012.1 D-ribose pyranase [Streptomyces subrutilus]GGZ81745.1 D-ribose pyranase [Streptomyces subrutilus]
MRAEGLWHPRLLHLVASLGHGELLVVADPGLPVPAGVECVDLVWRRGDPPLGPVLACVLGELAAERATVAAEAADPGLLAVFARELAGLPVDRVAHAELKELTGRARAVVRTGEATPYANVVLRAGVPF